MCDWIVINNLNIHLGEYKTKSILFSTKKNNNNNKKKIGTLEIKYDYIQI